MLPPVRGRVPGSPMHCLQQDAVRQVSIPHIPGACKKTLSTNAVRQKTLFAKGMAPLDVVA